MNLTESWTPSTKSVNHRESLLKGVAVQWVLYQSILNAKLTGRKKLGRKMCTSNRDFKQPIKHLGVLYKEWTEAGVSASRVTTLSGPKSSFQMKSKFCISFGNQGPRVWRKTGVAQNPCCLKSSEGRYQSNLGFYYTWAVSQADFLQATQHWCSN